MNTRNKKVFDVAGGRDAEGQNVQIWKRHNGANQRWRIVHLDEKTTEPTKGLDKEFGFFMNRPFFIVSKLWMGRVAEVVGGRNIILKSRSASRKS